MGTEQDSHSGTVDQTAEGVVIIGAGERSSVEHTTLIIFPALPRMGPSGAVVFEVNGRFQYGCLLIGNQIGDDFLNVIRANHHAEKGRSKISMPTL